METDSADGRAAAVRRLTAADAPAYRTLRLEALRLHPEAFSSDFAMESQMSVEVFAARMPSAPGGVFGAFVRGDADEARLAGIAGLVVQPRARLRHKGLLVGMYVAAPYRRRGIAHMLVTHVLAEARAAGLRVVQLGITAGNEPARRLYTRLGFRRYGVEPDALCVDGRFYDEELMALDLHRVTT